MERNSTYRYQSLPPIAEEGRTPSFTRLLFLYPGSGEDPFEAHLEIVDIEHAPPYEALSYTWGKPTEQPRDYIWMQGCPMPIRPNLEDALRSLRLPNQVRRLWVDALCIDQSDLDERARQVQYMRLVYKHAARVIVWLGLKTSGTHEAFQAAERLARIRELTHPAATGPNGGQIDPGTVQGLMSSMLEDLPETCMIHLDEVFERQYFSRCWCVQEVVASSRAIAKIEDLEMSFFDLIASLIVLAGWKSEILIDRPYQLWNLILMRRQPNSFLGQPEVEGSIGSFLALLELTRTLQATDDRDKVFSLLGICDEGLNPVLALTQVFDNNDSWRIRLIRRGLTRVNNFVNGLAPDLNFGRPRALRPDYKRETVLVYCDLTRFLLRKQPRILDVLDHVQHNEDPGIGDYPSWVPKWFEPRTCSVFKGAYLAGFCDGHFRYFAELHDIPVRNDPVWPKVLSIDGYHVDVVSKTTETLAFEFGARATAEAIVRAWEQLFDIPIAPRCGRKYRDNILLDVVFCKAILAGALGSIIGYSHLLTRNQGGLNPLFDDRTHKPHAELDREAQDLAETFLTQMAEFGLPPTATEFGNPDREDKLQVFGAGARTYSNNRKVFATRDGRVGIGPKMMQPGDEVVVLFGGRMPFIARQRGDHRLLVGSCYLVDEELMWGKVTEKLEFSMTTTKHSKMKILLIGKGGREHALAWKLTRSQSVEHVYVLPGNAGTGTLTNVSNCRGIAVDDYGGLVELSKRLEIDLVIIGPDDAVVGGMGDHFRSNGIRCFAPSKRAAIIEGSKDFAKDFMCRRKIPTACYETFDRADCDKAKAYVRRLGRRVVIKVDGLAAGKGVILPETTVEAEQALEDIMLKGKFGDAGEMVIIEEYLEGYEISVLTFTDGTSILSLPPSQDHKRALDGDKGLNTGGMGVYAPVPSVTEEQMADIEEKIILPTIDGLKLERRPFNGMLFTGVMMTSTGPKVLEYNARFGDPETQSMVLLLPDEALPEIILACVEDRLGDIELKTLAGFACNITVAAKGYPESYREGDLIRIEPTSEGVHVFHAGTDQVDDKLFTAGGHVLSVAATGETLEEAVSAAYKGVESVHFEGMFYRKDVAMRSLKLAPGRAEDGPH
ncbi:HET domain-containing protein [Colletotrichum tamarilloi]|uniref:phosphoribosylamine--glycine ligase n=1 Tax=Colletotrichum tamarilloi TaxID=1209934 RepID=A0ABQ9R6V3_9PEZI|nr:HET domain-containing protein [Colletotrichum tamarilloi]KAK1496259.1 HET domain-containing protein [Colletotrichum tamarilloi]